MSASDLRRRLLEWCDVLQAVLAFNYALTPQEKSRLSALRGLIPTATSTQLRDYRDTLREAIRQCKGTLAPKQDLRKFASAFKRRSLDGRGTPMIAKGAIDESFFGRFAAGNVGWGRFPPHLLLFVDYEWTVREDGTYQFHFYLPEAVMYEDMALAYNDAATTAPGVEPKRARPGDIHLKRRSMQLRTAILSAFYFVEAYLNGIAFDHVFRHRHDLDAAQADLLMEWDSEHERRRYVSFEKKISRYPRIILDRADPPLTAENCKDLGVLLGTAKDFRDAIVHQSPMPRSTQSGEEGAAMVKVGLLASLNLADATEIVDAAVGFVTELGKLLPVGGAFRDWLYPRDSATGQFPPTAFE